MNNCSKFILGLLIGLILALALTAWYSKIQGAGAEKIEKLKNSTNLSHQCQGADNKTRTFLLKPEEDLLWPDYDYTPAARLWCTLSITMAGFALLAIVTLFQTHGRKSDSDDITKFHDTNYRMALSSLMAALFIFVVAADLYTWADGDRIEIRFALTFMAANFVVAIGLLGIFFSLNCVLQLYSDHVATVLVARSLFFAMLLYTGAFVIPTSGDVICLMDSYEKGIPADTLLSTNLWYNDTTFLLAVLPPAILFPLIAYFLSCWPRSYSWFSSLGNKSYVALFIGLLALFLGVWVVAVNYLILYTGDPVNPVIIEQVKILAPPYWTQGILMSIYGLIAAFLILFLPRAHQDKFTPEGPVAAPKEKLSHLQGSDTR